MKRRTLFVALASAFSLSLSAYAHGNRSSEDHPSRSQATQRSQSSDLVKQAQQKLSEMGKDVGTPNGRIGPKTQQALKEYQQENGLQPSGQLDRQTIAALDLNTAGAAATGSSERDFEPLGKDTGPSDSHSE